MKTEAHRIALECYEENFPAEWLWGMYQHRPRTPGELLAWAIIKVEKYAPLGTTQDTLIEAAKYFIKLLYKI